MNTLTALVLKGAAAGLIAALATDLGSFKSWKSFDDALSYDWKVAAFRWIQGAVLGALSALGVGAVL
jgi:hypothetical protein